MARRRRKKTESLWPAKLGVFSLRVFTGAVFFDAALYKLVVPDRSLGEAIEDFAEKDYVPLVQQAVEQPPVVLGWRMDWYASLLENLMLPGNAPYVFGGAILFFELLLGISLVLGAGVRLMGLLGAWLMIGFGLARGAWFLTTRAPNWILMVILLSLALMAAGRIWGLDAKLSQRLPRWIS